MPSHNTDCKSLPCLSGKFKIGYFPYLVYHGVSHLFAVITIAFFYIFKYFGFDSYLVENTAYYNACTYKFSLVFM